MAEIADDLNAAITEQREGEPALDKTGEEEGRRWRAEIRAACKAQQPWIDRGRKIEKLYADRREERADRARRFNILWANVETLRPAVYMTPPKAQATRRQMDRDPVARLAAQLIERALQTSCEIYDFDHCMDQMVRDWLLPGRGQAWVSYQPTFETVEPQQPAQSYGGVAGGGMGDAMSPVPPMMGAQQQAPMQPQPPDEQLTYEEVISDYVPWSDFMHSAGARTWAEVTWVGRRLLFTRRKGMQRFGEAFKDAPLTWKAARSSTQRSNEAGDEEKQRVAQAEVIEVWDKESGDVLFVLPDAQDDNAILERKPAPIRFRNFFPCPRPLLATTTSESLIPTPDYAQYQDQAQELNTLTGRIDKLQRALKVAGLYDAANKDIARLLEADEGKMIPCESWAMSAEDGGVRGMIEWYPVETVITVLRELYTQRTEAKNNLYEVSGIADIMRGVSDPTETLGAQQIKQRWSGTRLRKRQKEVQRVARELFQLKAEVIAEVFQFSTILQMASADAEMIGQFVPQGTDPQIFLREVEAMLRNDALRTFQIKVAPDSTLEPDEQAEQESRGKVLASIGGLMQQGAALVQQGPEGAKLLGSLIEFALRSFKDADSLEEALRLATEAAAKKVAQAQANPPPNPEMEKLKLEAQDAQAEHAEKQQQMKADAMQGKADFAVKMKELEIKERELALKERELASREAALQSESARQDAELALSINDRSAENEFRAHEAEQRDRELDASERGAAFDQEEAQVGRMERAEQRSDARQNSARDASLKQGAQITRQVPARESGGEMGSIAKAMMEMAAGMKEAAAAMTASMQQMMAMTAPTPAGGPA